MDTTTYPQIEIKELRLFSVWQFLRDELNKVCPICKKLFTELCIECECEQSGDEVQNCPVVQGQCSHVFHKHCIKQWFTDQSKKGLAASCGFCSQVWDVSTQIVIDK